MKTFKLISDTVTFIAGIGFFITGIVIWIKDHESNDSFQFIGIGILLMRSSNTK